MPYADKVMQRSAVKEAVRRHRMKESLEEMGDEETFDIKEFFQNNQRQLALSLTSLMSGKKTSVKALELIVKMLGLITEKKEETHKFEFSTADRIRVARETIAGLREQYNQDGGICPVCLRPKVLCDKILLDSKSKREANREVAAVAVSTRLD